MAANTPLLLLLDGILSQDEARTRQALEQIQGFVTLPRINENPLRSARALETIVHAVMASEPHQAQVASQHDGSLPLHFAASIGNIRVAHFLLEKFPQAACQPNTKGKTPLHYAAREGRADMVAFILRVVPETASILSKKGKLALHFAAGEGHVGVVRELLKYFPDGARLPSKKGKVALHFAARWGHMEIARMLYSLYPPCVSHLDYEGSLPLHDATREGQLEMAQFLTERFPKGLEMENIRGETALFPAVRSGNMDLCAYLIKAWPEGGKNVLQRVREEDNVQDWDTDLLDLCLRGAVNNFTGHGVTQVNAESQALPRSFAVANPLNDGESSESIGEANNVASKESTPATPPPPPILDIAVPRSKSPILVEGGTKKKRSLSCDENFGNKRSRRGSLDEDDPLSSLKASDLRQFMEVHACLECRASIPVLQCILDRFPEQLEKIDDLGRYPLHLAVENGRDEMVPIILERIWKPFKEACSERDFLGRLPLHLALTSKADCEIVEVLLESNPSSGVEHCEVVDTKFTDKLPIYMATESECDLSTVFMLLKGDPTVVKSWKDANQ